MPYVIEAMDRAGTADLRKQVRPVHVDYLKAHTSVLLAAGAKLSDDGVTAIGTLYIVDTEERDVAQRFADEDPFAQAGLFERTTVTRWRKAFFNFTNTMPADWDKDPAPTPAPGGNDD